MISAVRICKHKHAATTFNGMGAALEPGRWNSAGHPMVYTSECSALAFLEILVHTGDSLMPSYALIPCAFDDTLVEAVAPGVLPSGWESLLEPEWVPLQDIGTAWLVSLRTAVLRVPAAIVPDQYNYLLNPAHPDFAKINIGSLRTLVPDPRLGNVIP